MKERQDCHQKRLTNGILSYIFSNLSIQYRNWYAVCISFASVILYFFCSLFFLSYFHMMLRLSMSFKRRQTLKFMHNTMRSEWMERIWKSFGMWSDIPSTIVYYFSVERKRTNELLSLYVQYQVTMHLNNRKWRVFVSQFSHHFHFLLKLFVLYFRLKTVKVNARRWNKRKSTEKLGSAS